MEFRRLTPAMAVIPATVYVSTLFHAATRAEICKSVAADEGRAVTTHGAASMSQLECRHRDVTPPVTHERLFCFASRFSRGHASLPPAAEYVTLPRHYLYQVEPLRMSRLY